MKNGSICSFSRFITLGLISQARLPLISDFGRNVDENHALLLNETVAVGDRQDAPVLELFENRSEPALLRRADEKNLAALDLLDFLVKLDRELPAFDRPAPEIILERVPNGFSPRTPITNCLSPGANASLGQTAYCAT